MKPINSTPDRDPLDTAIEYITDEIDKKQIASCLVGGPKTKKTLFLQELADKIELLGYPSHNFQLSKIEPHYFDKYRSYITKIVDKIVGTISDQEGGHSEEPADENSDGSSSNLSGDGDNPVAQMMSGLGEIFKNILPQMGNMGDLMKNLEGANKELFESINEKKKEPKKDQDSSGEKVNLEWEEDLEDQDDLEHETVDEADENSEEEVEGSEQSTDLDAEENLEEESNESPDEGSEEGEESEVNPEEIQQNISNMVDMLKDNLGPMMQNLTGMFGKLFEGMKDLAPNVETETDDEEEGKQEDGEELDDHTDRNAENEIESEEIPTENETNESSPDDEWDIKIQRENAPSHKLNEELNGYTKKGVTTFTDDPRNLISKKLQADEMSKLMEEIIVKITELSQKSNPLVVFIDDIDNGDQYVFYVLERLLMQHKNIPLILVGGYSITPVGEKGEENKSLRLLLTKFKIEKLGKVIKLNMD